MFNIDEEVFYFKRFRKLEYMTLSNSIVLMYVTLQYTSNAMEIEVFIYCRSLTNEFDN